ncbi:MAG: hypothetical protein ACEPO8_00350 [Rhodothermaceae bacterium]
MGSNTILDIIGSSILGGILLLILFRVHSANSDGVFEYNAELMVQSNLVAAVQILEHDFRKIGYCRNWDSIPNPGLAFLSANRHNITFRSDIDNDGDIDAVRYYVGDVSELGSTPHPNDRKLYRQINGEEPQDIAIGLTQFDMKYFTSLGDSLPVPVANLGQIHTIQIDITLENTFAVAERYTDSMKYATAFWRQIRLASRNLSNR